MDGLGFFATLWLHCYNTASYGNYSVCLHFLNSMYSFFSLLSSTENCHYYSIGFNALCVRLFIIFFGICLFPLCGIQHCKNHVINRCIRMIESSLCLSWLIPFFFSYWMKPNPIFSILKNLQTPNHNQFFSFFSLLLFEHVCLSNTLPLVIANVIFMHLFCYFKSVALA